MDLATLLAPYRGALPWDAQLPALREVLDLPWRPRPSALARRIDGRLDALLAPYTVRAA